MTPKDAAVAHLMENPMASLLLQESEGEFCRQTGVWPPHTGPLHKAERLGGEGGGVLWVE